MFSLNYYRITNRFFWQSCMAPLTKFRAFWSSKLKFELCTSRSYFIRMGTLQLFEMCLKFFEPFPTSTWRKFCSKLADNIVHGDLHRNYKLSVVLETFRIGAFPSLLSLSIFGKGSMRAFGKQILREGTKHSILFPVHALWSLSSLCTSGKDLMWVPEKRMVRESTEHPVTSRSLARKLDCEESDGRTMLAGTSRVSAASVFSSTLSLVSWGVITHLHWSAFGTAHCVL